MRRLAFTLVELIIVTLIIAILVAILAAVLLRAREGGKRTSCLSHERQLGLALLQYTNDFDERFPAGFINAPGVGWAQKCLPYYKSPSVLECPDDTSAITGNPVKLSVSYAMNCNLSSYRQVSHGATIDRSISTLTTPSKTVLLFEVSYSYCSFGGPINDEDSASGNGANISGTTIATSYCLGTSGIFQVGSSAEAVLYATGNMGGRTLNTNSSVARHNGGSNYAAADAHEVWIRPSLVSSGDNAVATDCNQGTDRAQPPDCTKQSVLNAAGTELGPFKMTFSGR